ncbi:MAG: electron transfer flavoprotein subunit alpha/FixB family protein, partial [Acidimicrobiaceae bacterium]|nr:electron transfer flavoprotein subunit alpha/FixB family protein [Acidimicrobiaceae bacterium]
MGISKIWVFGEATETGATASTLELLTKARTLADSVEVVMAGDGSAVAGQLGAHGATTVHTVGDADGALPGARVASAIAGALEAGNGPDVLLATT